MRARSLGFVSEEDVSRLIDTLEAAEREGRPVRIAQLLLEQRLLTSDQLVIALRAAAAATGMRPVAVIEPTPPPQRNPITATPTPVRPAVTPSRGHTATPTPTHQGTDSAIMGEGQRSASTSLKAGDRLGDYELVREIARGGMGVLFEARLKGAAAPSPSASTTQKQLRRAIKVLSARATSSRTLLHRFRQEAALASSLDHPNIVKIHEVSQDRGFHFIVMDYFDGRSLAELLRSGTLAPKKAVQVIATIARAVQYVHDCAVLHRDLKPANVLVGHGGKVVLTDFGLAKDFARQDMQLTQLGVAVGTPAYMSPEQARGESGTIGPWSDVYALGATLYRALSGHYPYDADNFMAAVQRIAREDPPPLRTLRPDCPPALLDVVGRAMARDPNVRPTANGLADALDQILATNPLSMPPPPANPKA